MRVFAYIRVSSDEQSRHGTSLDGQRGELEGYCAARRWPAPTVFREVESGAAEKLGARVELQRLIAEVRAYAADVRAQKRAEALRARWYLGEIRRVDGTWVPAHEPIVTVEVFERAARTMKTRAIGGRPPGADTKTSAWLLRGLGVCPQCGSRMGAAYSPIQNYYYACNGRRGKKDCAEPYVPVTWADAEASRLTLERLAELRELLAQTGARRAKAKPDAARLESLKASLASAKLRRTRTVTLAVEGVIQTDELRSRLSPIDTEIASLGIAIDDEERRMQPLKPERRAEVLRDISVIQQLWSNLPIARKRDIISLMASRVEINVDEIRLTWRSVAELSKATVGASLLAPTVATSGER